MTGVGILFYEVFIHILQLTIFSLAGAALTKCGAFDRVGENRQAEANLHVFIPLFCFVTFSLAVRDLSGDSLALLFFTFVISSFVALAFAYVYCLIFKADVRIIRVFYLLNAFGDVAFLPEVLVGGLCGEHGILEGDPNCKHTVGYSMYVLFLFNTSLLIIGPFLMHSDKALSFNVLRKMIIIKHFYPSAQAFLDDKELTALDKIEGDKLVLNLPSPEKSPGISGVDRLTTATNILGKEMFPKIKFYDTTDSKVKQDVLEDPELVQFSLDLHLDRTTYQQLDDHFDKLMQKINPQVFNSIYDGHVPAVVPYPKLDLNFLIHICTSPAVIGCVAGMIVGRIMPIMDWLYTTDCLKIFYTTIQHIAGLAIPLAVMIWGIQLYSGFGFKGSNIRLKDLIALIIIRLIIVPAIGLGFTYGLSQDGIGAIDNDKVLHFSIFANWVVPPGLLLLTLFVLCGYYAKEGAIMMFWAMMATEIAAPLYSWAYIHITNIGI